MRAPRPFRVAVAIGCIYELAALPDRTPIPTISAISQHGSRHRRFRVVSWLWAGYAAAHMLDLDKPAFTGRHLRFLAWLVGGYALAVAFRITDA